MACNIENLDAGVERSITQALVANGVAPAEAASRARTHCGAGAAYLNARYGVRRAALPPELREPRRTLQAYQLAFADLALWAPANT